MPYPNNAIGAYLFFFFFSNKKKQEKKWNFFIILTSSAAQWLMIMAPEMQSRGQAYNPL